MTTLEELFGEAARWEIRTPKDTDDQWIVFPDYRSDARGEGKSLEDAVQVAVNRIKDTPK